MPCRSAEDFAMDLVFRDNLQMNVRDELNAIFAVDEIVNGPEVTSLHRIVLGRSPRPLEEELAERPELINVGDMCGRTPLVWAVRRKDIATAERLLAHGADLKIADCEGRTVFHEVARAGSVEFAHLLRRATRKHELLTAHDLYHDLVNAPDIYNLSPWHIAVRYNNPLVLQVFLEHGCEISLAKNISRSVLHLAADYGILHLLNLRAIAPESEGVFGWSPESFLQGRLDGSDSYSKYCSTNDSEAYRRLQEYVMLLQTAREEMACSGETEKVLQPAVIEEIA